MYIVCLSASVSARGRCCAYRGVEDRRGERRSERSGERPKSAPFPFREHNAVIPQHNAVLYTLPIY